MNILPIINILLEIKLSNFYYPVKIMNSSILQNTPCLFSLCVCLSAYMDKELVSGRNSLADPTTHMRITNVLVHSCCCPSQHVSRLWKRASQRIKFSLLCIFCVHCERDGEREDD